MTLRVVKQNIDSLTICETGKCIEARPENFEQLIKESLDSILVIDFWAPWCKPCKKVGVILEELASEYSEAVKIAKMNIDLYPLFNQFEIMALPYFRIYKNGKFIGHFNGSAPKKKFKAVFDKLLSLKV